MATLRITRAHVLPDPLSRLLELHRLCFSDYVGVLPSEQSFLEWYLKRPGGGEGNVFVFRNGDSVISALFLTLSHFRLGDDYLPVGIIDTVMTHPDYRKRGLASRLMEEAEKFMREKGCRFGYLYTIPGTSQFGLYQKLGYRDHKRVFHLLNNVSRQAPGSFPVDAFRLEEARIFLNRFFEEYNGFIPFEDPMWKWRKIIRPPMLPIHILNYGKTAIQSSITVSMAQVTTGKGDWVEAAFLSDWAGISPSDLEMVLRSALSIVPGGTVCDILCPVDNIEEWDILVNNGFQKATEESAMLYPLDEGARILLGNNREGKWYPLIESVVGA